MSYNRTVSGTHPISEVDWAIDGDTWAEFEADVMVCSCSVGRCVSKLDRQSPFLHKVNACSGKKDLSAQCKLRDSVLIDTWVLIQNLIYISLYFPTATKQQSLLLLAANWSHQRQLVMGHWWRISHLRLKRLASHPLYAAELQCT